MRVKEPKTKRAALRMKERALETQGRALYDLSVRYAYDVRMTYGNDRIPFIKDYDKEWREYCFANKGSLIDLNANGFMNFAKDKSKVKEFQEMLKIYFEPELHIRIKNLMSKY